MQADSRPIELVSVCSCFRARVSISMKRVNWWRNRGGNKHGQTWMVLVLNSVTTIVIQYGVFFFSFFFVGCDSQFPGSRCTSCHRQVWLLRPGLVLHVLILQQNVLNPGSIDRSYAESPWKRYGVGGTASGTGKKSSNIPRHPGLWRMLAGVS